MSGLSGVQGITVENLESHDDGQGHGTWQETARWVKFEEDLEAGGDRWSKPHVGTIAMHAIKEIEVQVQADKGCVILDLETHSIQAKFFMIIFIDARTGPDRAGPDGSDIYYHDKNSEL